MRLSRKVFCPGERNYVQIQAGRKVVPTELGITLVRGYQLIDSELCSPQVQLQRSSELAQGLKDKVALQVAKRRSG